MPFPTAPLSGPNRVRDSRRVPGPSMWNDGPAVLLDIETHEPERAIVAWNAALDRLLDAAPVSGFGRRIAWPHRTGVTLGFEAPQSVLYDAVDLNELAAEVALGLRRIDEAVERARRLAPSLAASIDTRLETLARDAAFRGVNVLVGEAKLSLGSGAGTHAWPLATLPHPDAVPWTEVTDVPLALVTGTNGKTTTTRLLRRMIDLAGLTGGHTSTEGVHVGAETIVEGDFAGPEGARRLLRDRRVEAAVLETSRGGLLRRGLAVQRAAVAVVTNVGADHMGDYGIWSVEDIARAKLSVRKGLASGAPLVVNADDAVLWPAAQASGHRRLWPFSLDPGHADLAPAAVSATVIDGVLVRTRRPPSGRAPATRVDVGRIDAMPLAYGGAARYNVQNALAAVLAATALGLPDDAIAAALRTFGASPDDNPGRMNVYAVAPAGGGRATVVLDYGHNDDGIRAVAPALATLPRRRLRALISQAGDRSDADNARMAAEIVALGPDDVAVTELPGYERGRAVGETVDSLARGFEAHGLGRDRQRAYARPLDGAAALLDDLRDGDLVVLFLHDDRADVLARVRALPPAL